MFNTKYPEVLDWVRNLVDFERNYIKAERNSAVIFDKEQQIPYPIENHVYYFPKDIQNKCIKDFLQISKNGESQYTDFEDFLRKRFGETLYELYFRPYNEKVWRCSLKTIPLSWLDGKLPMPTIEEIFFNNMNHIEERGFVHSTFWYPKNNGSQFFADKLAEGLNIRYSQKIEQLRYCDKDNQWTVNGELYDKIVFCGNIKQIPSLIVGVDISRFAQDIDSLQYHGTTTVFCEIERNPYSWMYLPSAEYNSHRIICTGNFSPLNNAEGKMTATVEFTDEIDKESVIKNLAIMPYAPKYIDHIFNKYTYPIQDATTRDMIKSIKSYLVDKNFFMTGRFADWEYYNMDVAIKAAMDICDKI